MKKIKWQFLGKEFLVQQEQISMLKAYKTAYNWYTQLGNKQEAIKAAKQISAILRKNGYSKGCN